MRVFLIINQIQLDLSDKQETAAFFLFFFFFPFEFINYFKKYLGKKMVTSQGMRFKIKGNHRHGG